MEIEFSGLLIVAAVAFAVPLALGLAPGLRLPGVVLEIVAGIIIGPSVLGWVEVDEAIEVLSVIGLAFLLFLAGLEIDPERLRGRPLRLSGLGFVVSLALAVVCGYVLEATGAVETPLLVAIILVATSLGVIIPLLKDAGESSSEFGQLVIAGSSIADFGAVLLLTFFFSREATDTETKLILLGGFLAVVIVGALAWSGLEHSMRFSTVLARLQDTSAQIRVRGAFLLLAGFVALAEGLGLEAILGAFMAGAVLALIDRDEMNHPQFRLKLEAIGFGVFIPIFFVTSGLRFNLDALFESGSTIVRVPVFLAALLLVRGVPALLYQPLVGSRRAVVAGLLQATSLPFIVAATQIGMELDMISEANGAALVAAGLLSVLIFPIAALTILRNDDRARAPRSSQATRRPAAPGQPVTG